MELHIVRGRSIVRALARAPLHTAQAEGHALTGTVTLDPADLAGTLRIDVVADIASIRSGEMLLDDRSHAHVEVTRYPLARFVLARAAGTPEALRLEGTLSWRGHDIEISTTAKVQLDDAEVRGHARLSLDMRRFGLTAPKLLFLKVEDVVQLAVEIVAVRG
jgi:hypothetical protein